MSKLWPDAMALAVVTLFVLAASSAAAGESVPDVVLIRVAPGGGALGEGIPEAGADGSYGPYATVRDALELAARLPDKGRPCRVEIAEGAYFIAEPVVIEPAHSRAMGMVISGAGVGKTVVHGGRRVTGWKEGADGVWTAHIPEAAAGGWDFSAIYVNGERRDPARTPNSANPAGDYPPDSDFFYMDGPVVETGADGKQQSSNVRFRFREGDIQPWSTLDQSVFVIFHSWATSLLRPKEVDWENRIITFTGPARWPFGYWRHDQWYFVQQLREALDAPGEWFLDRNEGTLHYMPMPGEDLARAEVVAPVAPQLLVTRGDAAAGNVVDLVTVEGISFRYGEFGVAPAGHSDAQAAFAVPAAIDFAGARRCVIRHCEVAHVGSYGVWFRAGSKDCRIERCEVWDLGAGGVRVGEGADPASPEEATERIVIHNNYLHDGGRLFRSAVGVWIGRSSYNEVSHNEVCDFRYSGMSVGWSWGYQPSSAHHNLIAYNRIHHVGKGQLSDMGGIYTLGPSPGTVLRNNYIHDILSNPKISGGWGLYTDEGSSEILMENNIIHHTVTGTFHQHYGRENVLRNNILAFSQREQLIRSREEDHVSFLLEGNIVYLSNGRLLGSQWGNGNFFLDKNLYWDTSGAGFDFAGQSFDEWQAAGHDRHSRIADPLFADIENHDFRLRAGSPALEMGFRPIDTAEIGLYGETEWTEKPRRVERAEFVPPAPPPPVALRDGFEDRETGMQPEHASVSEEGTATIRVTDEAAFSGNRSLRFTDTAGLSKPYDPHLVYRPHIKHGAATVRFAVRMGKDATFYHEWRDNASPYRAGPSLWFHPDGRLTVGGETLETVPVDEWTLCEVTCTLGNAADGTFSLKVTTPDGATQTHADLPCSNGAFNRFDWCGFVANGDGAAAIHMDDLAIEEVRQGGGLAARCRNVCTQNL